jgi:sulfate permease, SulP family
MTQAEAARMLRAMTDGASSATPRMYPSRTRLAYALLAGLPAEVGLYASMLPLVAYAIFGTSRTLAVGPVAVVSLMTAAALGKLLLSGPAEYAAAAITLAALSGVILLALGIFRLGFLANFLSHPVIAGFITASGILIAAGQLKNILGIKANGDNLIEIGKTLVPNLNQTNFITLFIGVAATAFLFWVRKGLKPLLLSIGLRTRMADLLARTGPIFALAATTLAAWSLDLGAKGVKLVGTVPQGFCRVSPCQRCSFLLLALLNPFLSGKRLLQNVVSGSNRIRN